MPGFVEAFAGRCWSGAWAPSVAGLSRPGPTAGQYLRSFLPGSHFLISWAPRAQIGRPETVSSFARRDVPRMLLVDEPGLSPAVSAQLAEATGATKRAAKEKAAAAPAVTEVVVDEVVADEAVVDEVVVDEVASDEAVADEVVVDEVVASDADESKDES